MRNNEWKLLCKTIIYIVNQNTLFINNFIKILNIKISTLSKVEILGFIKNNLIENKKIFIATPNPEFLLEANKNEKFKNILNSTDLNIPDGIGIIYASNILNTSPKIKERRAGSDLTLEIIKIAKDLNKKIFLLGGNDEEQLELVKNKIGNEIVLDYDIGFEKIDWDNNLNPNEEKNNLLINKINNSNAEIIFVAFGAPKQEYWIYENLNKLKNIKLAIGIGGTFDFIAGYKKRAPVWMQKTGLEWLFRLIQEPGRFKRIFNAVIIFPIKIIISKFKKIK